MPAVSGRGDALATWLFAFLYTVGSGMASIAFPLVALENGLGAAQIGAAVTSAALVQIVARASLGSAMRYVSDQALLMFGAVVQLVSFAALLVSTSFVMLTVAWTMQAIARSCFWTCGQTHVVRGVGGTVRVLAIFNFIGGVGQFVGPLLAGVVASSNPSLALVGGVVVSAASIVPVAVLERHHPAGLPEKTGTRRLLREPGMSTACWGSVGAGAWRSLMDSFVPVVLDAARYSSTAIGALVSVSNGAAILGALAVGRMKRAISPATYTSTMVATAIGIGSIGVVADVAVAASLALAVSGFAAGMLQTLSPAIASSSAPPHERGAAIAISGTSRAVAMFAAPLVVTLATVMVPVAVGLLGVGVALSVPAVTEARRI